MTARLGVVERRPIAARREHWFQVEERSPAWALVTPAHPGIDLASALQAQPGQLSTWLARHGSLLFRGFDVGSASDFAAVVRAVAGTPLAYLERSSPRDEVVPGIYTSTRHPADQPIHLHCENAYQLEHPSRLLFWCERPAVTGGETWVADCERVLAAIPEPLRRRFEALGVRYLRNFGDGVGLGWVEAFGTSDRDRVEAMCRDRSIDVQWTCRGLRTSQVRPAIVEHPTRGRPVWFNHAAFFHAASLDPELRTMLVEQFGEDGLPTHTSFGDGTPIADEDVDAINAAYELERAAITWEARDLLVVDNLAVAHGRAPFSGARRVLVALAAPVSVAG